MKVHYSRKLIYIKWRFFPLNSLYVSSPLLYLHFNPTFHAILLWFAASPLHFAHPHLNFLHSAHSHSDSSHSHSPCCLIFSPHSPHFVTWFPILAFTGSHFLLLTQNKLLISENLNYWIDRECQYCKAVRRMARSIK